MKQAIQRSPRSGRPIFQIASAFLIGLLTSIAVAWYFAIRSETSFTFGHRVGVNAHPEGQPTYLAWFKVSDEYRPGFRRIEVEATSKPITPLVTARVQAQLNDGDFNPREKHGSQPSQRALWFPWVPRPAAEDPPMQMLAARASGWPRLCMSSTRKQASGAAQPTVRGAIPIIATSAYKTSASDPDRGTLPLVPIWSGLLINSVLFAFPWLVLMLILPALRRSLRRRRGLCPRCAYDLRATPAGSPCPECGYLAKPAQATSESGLS